MAIGVGWPDPQPRAALDVKLRPPPPQLTGTASRGRSYDLAELSASEGGTVASNSRLERASGIRRRSIIQLTMALLARLLES